MKKTKDNFSEIRDFYNNTYYASASETVRPSLHHLKLAKKLNIASGIDVLDVACGVGEWLSACQMRGASVSGIDISGEAIKRCKNNLAGDFFEQPAEKLPFEDKKFDVVTCLGSLEHFIDPAAALDEMVRVLRDDGVLVILVPNIDFLTRKLGIFTGTYQVDVKEEARSLGDWDKLFQASGVVVERKWKDLHVLSLSWICRGKPYLIPLRFLQAIALLFWPLCWQYQVYHQCRKSNFSN